MNEKQQHEDNPVGAEMEDRIQFDAELQKVVKSWA
jgi:hypothetical protein